MVTGPQKTYDVDIVEAAQSAYGNMFSFGGMTVKDGDCIFTLGEDGLFHRLPIDYEIPDDEVYLMVPWEIQAEVLIPWIGDPTGVKNVSKDEQILRAYNLLGQKVRPDSKGMIIINGKKVKR